MLKHFTTGSNQNYDRNGIDNYGYSQMIFATKVSNMDVGSMIVRFDKKDRLIETIGQIGLVSIAVSHSFVLPIN